jgi:HEAT repeat protein
VAPTPVAPPATSPPAPTYAAPATYAAPQQDGAERHLQLLASPDERVRADAALELGRMRATRAIDRLAAALAGDRSPAVRDAAARALGLIGDRRALPALQHAAQADGDRDVRRSAQFAVEVITAQLRRD